MADKPPVKEDIMYLNQQNDWHLYYTFAMEHGMNQATSEKYADKMIVLNKNLRVSLDRYNDNDSSLVVDINAALLGR